jgi:hypothetical protein
MCSKGDGEMDYKEHFKNIPLETKRYDLLNHPMIDKDKVSKATDEQVEQIYYELFSSFDMAMRDILGEGMFDDEF